MIMGNTHIFKLGRRNYSRTEGGFADTDDVLLTNSTVSV